MNTIRTTEEPLFDYLNTIPASKWAISQFQEGRHLSNTTDSFESLWSDLRVPRSSIILAEFYISAFNWTRSSIQKVLIQARNWQNEITPHAQSHFESLMSEAGNARRYSVYLKSPTAADIQETFSSDTAPSHRQVFSVEVADRLRCSCQKREYFELPCLHILIFSETQNLLHEPTAFFGSKYWRTSWLAGLEGVGEPPSLSFSLSGSNNLPNDFLPPLAYGLPKKSLPREYWGMSPTESWADVLRRLDCSPRQISNWSPDDSVANPGSANSNSSEGDHQVFVGNTEQLLDDAASPSGSLGANPQSTVPRGNKTMIRRSARNKSSNPKRVRRV